MPTKKLYHCFPKSKLKSVLQKGLDPKHSKSSLSAIFLTDDLFTARNYSNMQSDEKEFVIVSVKLQDLKEEELGPDNYELQDYLDTHKSKFEYWNETTWQYSLQKVNQIAYYGIIKPEFLKIEEEFKS